MTVALGSSLATILLSKDAALFKGLLALIVLAVLQFSIAWGSVRWRWIENVAKATPRRLLTNGVIDEAALRDERVTRNEVLAAIRTGGFGGLDAVATVVLETDGSFSVIPVSHAASGSALP